MPRTRSSLPIGAVRRISLAAQGLAVPPAPSRAGIPQFRRALRRMAIVQLDSVNVLSRSHYLPMFARLGPYDRDRLDHWLWRSRENQECFAHEASLTAMELRPLLRWRMRELSWKAGLELERQRPETLDGLIAEIREHGPRSVKTMNDPGQRTGSWWGTGPGKFALSWLHRRGRLAVDHRDAQFTAHYELPERVIPAEVASRPTPRKEDAVDELLVLAARSHGVGTLADLADYFRIKMRDARPAALRLVNAKRLVEVDVEGWSEPAYRHPDARCPAECRAATLLSPFDPLVWFRPRAERLFGFHYRIEIYVPPAKRVHGYYVLPFLLGEQIVARVDLKAERQTEMLRVQAAYLEPGAERDTVALALADALGRLASWLGLRRVAVVRKGNLARALAAAT